MAGTEPGGQARRRFITRHHVEDAAAAGQPIRVQGRDVVTDEAVQRATDLGVRIERDQATRATSGSSGRPSASTTPSASSAPSVAAPATRAEPVAPAAPATRSASDTDLSRAVRAAVIAELGTEPPGLDGVIDRVLSSRSR